jgi:uncharacterized membrane protein SpoIIM required for sporulation
MFWARYHILWWAILGEILIAGLLIRTGLAYFNREELLGRELDVLRPGHAWRLFKSAVIGKARSIFGWYRLEIPNALRSMGLAAIVMVLSLGLGVIAGISQARVFPLPGQLLTFNQLDSGFIEGLDALKFLSVAGVGSVWMHNLRAVILATLLGVFSFGVLGVVVLMLPIALIAYIAANVAVVGGSPWTFLAALVLPHGILEIPAILLAGMAILNLGATLTAPAEGKTIGEALLVALAKWVKVVVGLVVPLFLAAALVEVYITPRIAVWVLGR